MSMFLFDNYRIIIYFLCYVQPNKLLLLQIETLQLLNVAAQKILRGKRARCDTKHIAREASALRHKKCLPRCPPPYFRASSMPGGNLSSLTFNMLKNLYEVPNLSLQFLYYFYHQLSPGCVAKVEKRERESTVLQLDI